MDCDTVANNNNYHHHPTSHHNHHHRHQLQHHPQQVLLHEHQQLLASDSVNPVNFKGAKDVAECQSINSQFPNHYHEFIVENHRVCELNRYKYYQQNLHLSRGDGDGSATTTDATPAHLAIGNYEESDSLEGCFIGSNNETPSKGLLHLMDSPRAQGMVMVDNRVSAEQQRKQSAYHRLLLTKYRDIDEPLEPENYHMEANIYVRHGKQNGNTSTADLDSTATTGGMDEGKNLCSHIWGQLCFDYPSDLQIEFHFCPRSAHEIWGGLLTVQIKIIIALRSLDSMNH